MPQFKVKEYCPLFTVYVQIFAAQFLRIAFSKHFAETIFMDQEFRVYSILKFRELNFRGLLKSAKTVKIMHFENLDTYGMLKVHSAFWSACVNRNYKGHVQKMISTG